MEAPTDQKSEMTHNGSRSKTRLPRYRRVDADNLPRFRFMQRDSQIIEAVYRCRLLSKPQIEKLFFYDPVHDARPASIPCNRRLKYLYHHGFLQREVPYHRIMDGSRPFIYFLDKRGRDYLADKWDEEPHTLDWKPSHNNVKTLFLDHQLAINDIRVNVVLASRLHNLHLEQWVDDLTLRKQEAFDVVKIQGRRGRQYASKVIPDSYFSLNDDSGRYHFQLEMDLGTETGPTFGRKVRGYLAWSRSGTYQQRYKTKASMRVLVVTTTERRRDNLIKATENVGGGRQFWFTTIADATPERILTDAIWITAKGNTSRLRILSV